MSVRAWGPAAAALLLVIVFFVRLPAGSDGEAHPPRPGAGAGTTAPAPADDCADLVARFASVTALAADPERGPELAAELDAWRPHLPGPVAVALERWGRALQAGSAPTAADRDAAATIDAWFDQRCPGTVGPGMAAGP